ncbi:MFS transporter [Ferroplasma acidiphilum]|uniref:MFS transporter n=1 Tax=Ferroplasma acidiphilum TaxID=74969 RepID=A0A7K4FQ98_9ARCH|nr:MFS transporter [Ferroplasma acidiphilum]NOL60439.1 MFS transporter [Ferroplasma acidiphilum]
MAERNVPLITGASTVRGFGYSSIWIYSSLYMHDILKISLLYVGIIFTAGGFIAALVNIYGGAISDRAGYKETMIFSFSISVVIYAILSFVPGVSLSALLYPVAFIMFMIANAIMSPASNALISRSSDIQLKGFSILRVGNNIGWGFGPAIGGFIESFGGYHLLFVFGLIMGIISLGISLFLKNIKYDGKIGKVPLTTSNTLLIQLSLIALLLFVVQSQETVTLTNYATIFRSIKIYQLGIVYLTNGIFVIILQGFIYKIIRKIGNFGSFAIGSFVYSFGYFSYAFDTGL